MKSLSKIVLFSLLTLILLGTIIPVRSQPQTDKLRFRVVKSPDAQLIAMQTEAIHVLNDILITSNIETLDMEGFTILSSPGFHIAHIGFNIRPDQSYRTDRPPSELPLLAAVLSDINFRHAVIHAYDQDGILASLYQYVVTKSTSLVPPAQGGWMSPTVPQHPHNPGDPFTSPPGEDSSSGILKAAGYQFVDADSSGTVTSTDYWVTPPTWGPETGGQPLPTISLYTPTYEVAPTEAQHGAQLIASLNNIGLNNMEHDLSEFWPYLIKVFQDAEFDMYMMFWNLDRFPDHLYDMLHSSRDSAQYPWRLNAPGVNDAYIDQRLETIKESLVHEDKLIAAWEVQDYMYNTSIPILGDTDGDCDVDYYDFILLAGAYGSSIGQPAYNPQADFDDDGDVDYYDFIVLAANYGTRSCSPQALPYMQLYSRIYFNAHHPDLRGIVNSAGFGSDNMWTWLNIRWAPGTERIEGGMTIVVFGLADDPERLNPLWALTENAWSIMRPIMDGLVAVNPYTHGDLPWLADSWTLTPTPTGMDVTFDLAEGVTWQDGNPYTAEDARFNWLFLRDNQIPRYTSAWEHIVDVQVVTPGAGGVVKVILDTTSQFLLYDLAETAAILPPPVWSRLDGDQAAILAYDPSTNTTKPTGAGPRFGAADGPQNQLYGTGPWVFQFYDPVGAFADMPANSHYFKTTAGIQALLVWMFWKVGDVDRNGYIDDNDLSRIIAAYGSTPGDPNWDPDADINEDGFVDSQDYSIALSHWGQQREYP